MRVCWSLCDKMRVYTWWCAGRLQWNVLIALRPQDDFYVRGFIRRSCDDMYDRIEILCNRVTKLRREFDPKTSNETDCAWIDEGFRRKFRARPVDNGRQLWSFSGNVVPHRATYSSICWMIVLLRNQVWRRSIGQHFRRQHRIADSPPWPK